MHTRIFSSFHTLPPSSFLSSSFSSPCPLLKAPLRPLSCPKRKQAFPGPIADPVRQCSQLRAVLPPRDVWQYLETFLIVTVLWMVGCSRHLATDTATHPIMHRTAPSHKEFSALNHSSVRVRATPADVLLSCPLLWCF